MDYSKFSVKSLRDIIRKYNLHTHIVGFSRMGRTDLINSIQKFLHFIDNEFIPKSQKFSIKKPDEMKPRKPPTRKKKEIEPIKEEEKKQTKTKQKPKYKIMELVNKEPEPKYNITVMEPKKKEPVINTPENRRRGIQTFLNRMPEDSLNYIFLKNDWNSLKRNINSPTYFNKTELKSMKKKLADIDNRLIDMLNKRPAIERDYNKYEIELNKYNDKIDNSYDDY